MVLRQLLADERLWAQAVQELRQLSELQECSEDLDMGSEDSDEARFEPVSIVFLLFSDVLSRFSAVKVAFSSIFIPF